MFAGGAQPTIPPPVPHEAAPPTVASEASGSHVVTGYNHVESELAQASSGDDAAFHALAAHKLAAKTKKFVDDAKRDGKWAPGLRYQTANDGTFSEEDMLKHLDDLAARADTTWEQAKPTARKAWKQAYGAASDEALDKLEELGKPARVEKTKKAMCWHYEDDDGKQLWCWSAKGKLADHKVEKAEQAAVADSAPAKRGSYKKVSIFNGQGSCGGGSWAQGNAVIRDADGSYKECSLSNGQCMAPGSWFQGKTVVKDSDGSYKECDVFNGQPSCAGASWFKGDAVIWCDD
jgi:hypothetical protein